MKIGFVPMQNILVFGTAGGATGKVSGSSTYTATNNQLSPNLITAFGASSYDQTRTGYVVGGGVTCVMTRSLASPVPASPSSTSTSIWVPLRRIFP